MAIVARTVGDAFDYVSKSDPSRKEVKLLIDPNDPSKGEIISNDIMEGATVFKLRSLDVFLMGDIYDNAQMFAGQQGSNEFDIKTRINRTNIDAVRFGLVGFENFSDHRGVGMKFETSKRVMNGREYEVASDETLKMLDLTLIGELAQQIKDASEVKAADEKKYA